MAEGRGFEPREAIKPRWFSKPVLSTTQPPLPIVLFTEATCDLVLKDTTKYV